MAVLIYAVSLVVFFWGVFTANAENPIKNYMFTITQELRSPPGLHIPQPVILINGQFPGPPIDCWTNDLIYVTVINNLTEPFLLTWNGIQQRKNSWQDGVLGTNCPILPNASWTYRFQTKDQIGAYTYFASIGMQKAVSYGSLNVWQRPGISIPYPIPEANFTLLIGDWFNQSYKEMENILDSRIGSLPAPVALLINGEPGYNLTGEQGKQYMLRISNVGLSTSINFRIQGHKLKLVEVEGSHVIQTMFNSLDIFVGQSMTVLVTLDQPSNASYYIVASSTFSNTSLTVTGVLRYNNSGANLPVGPIPIGPKDDVRWSVDQARSIRWNLTANAARPNPQGSYNFSQKNVTKTIILENSASVFDGKQRYFLNKISYINPNNTPLKLADYFNISGVFNLTFPENTSVAGGYMKEGTYVLSASLHDFLEIIFQNNDEELQSYHLDGHSFWRVGMGRETWTTDNRNGSDAYNILDASHGHTIQVYPKSWSAIYVSLDNVGMWNLRSAIWERQYLGQQLYIRVKNPNPKENNETEYGIPANAIICGEAIRKI